MKGFEKMNQEYREAAQIVLSRLNKVILGKEQLTKEVFAAFLAGGHVLLEDIPGVGKTTLALAFSKLLCLKWKRVQFTPDVLPSDLTGFSIYQKDIQKFVYQPGAVFCNLLLADEINRTSPKTQSALLEVMEEKQVTVEKITRKVPSPFFVIATQNPFGTAGTQMLPFAQLDRFMISTSMGYPDMQNEILLAKGVQNGGRTDNLTAILNADAFLKMQQDVEQIYIHDHIYSYIVRLVTATRENPYIEIGVRPRGTISLVKIARANAWLNGNDFVSPSDVSSQFLPVALHRIQLNVKARIDGVDKRDVLNDILKRIEAPALRGKNR